VLRALCPQAFCEVNQDQARLRRTLGTSLLAFSPEVWGCRAKWRFKPY
jgi:hypothetical protein